jgi:DNA-binding CsgD family transcriptional regulator
VRIVVDEDVLRQRIVVALRRASGSSTASDAATTHEVTVISVAGADSLDAELSPTSGGEGGTIIVAIVPDSCNPRPLITPDRVQGVVLESEVETALPATIAATRAGQIVRPRGWDGSPEAFLSRREKQVLALVVMGMSNAEIGKRLGIVEATVKSHVSASYRKLDVGSRSEACARILDPHTGLGVGILALSAGSYDEER